MLWFTKCNETGHDPAVCGFVHVVAMLVAHGCYPLKFLNESTDLLFKNRSYFVIAHTPPKIEQLVDTPASRLGHELFSLHLVVWVNFTATIVHAPFAVRFAIQ